MKAIIFIVSLFLGIGAQAYKDGTYHCKNRHANLPDNVFDVKTVSLAGMGEGLPHVEITLYYKTNPGDVNSPVSVSKLRGLATVSSDGSDEETLSLAAMKVNFKDGEMINCKK